MRYLKVTAQDRGGNGKADTVFLHFFEESSGVEDTLVHKAYALDVSADGKVDFQVGDVNNDGKETAKTSVCSNRLQTRFCSSTGLIPVTPGHAI